VRVTYDDQHLRVAWPDGRENQFLHLWLRDHCPSSLHPTSRQRQVDTLEIPADTQPEQVIVRDTSLEVVWDRPVTLYSGSEVSSSTFSLSWLRERGQAMSQQQGTDTAARPQRELWARKEGLPQVSYGDWQTSDGLRHGLQSLYVHGALIVRGVPPSAADTQKAVERIGHARASFYGTFWDTAPKSEGQVNDTAYTNMELKPHNDGCYWEHRPGLQVFNCVAQSNTGGQTWLADGFAVATALREQRPEAFDFFARTALPFYSVDPEHDVHMRAMHKVISLDEEGELTAFGLNNDDRGTIDHLPEREMAAFYRHLSALLSLSRSPEYSCFVQLGVGDMLIVENYRVMHGRRSFVGSRNLVGCYMDRDIYESRLRILGIIS